jgi:hypothetical protein
MGTGAKRSPLRVLGMRQRIIDAQQLLHRNMISGSRAEPAQRC